VLIVEDAADTGLRLHVMVELVHALGAAEVAACVLLDRPQSRLVAGLPLRYRGFTVGEQLHVGYGLELGGRHGELPDLHALQAAAAA